MKQSAGILLYRQVATGVEVLLVHPGGPFWANKDIGSWSMPKGEFEAGEEPLAAARREFEEEIGSPPPNGSYAALGEVKQAGGKVVHAFVLESDFNLERFHSNMFEMEWPPKSSHKQEFPENDKAAWTPLSTAKHKVVKGQVPFIEELARRTGHDLTEPPPSAQSSLF
jgi:predicted NUDIX family NTP pyrophosphohydrolase